jgi:D-alanyl-D-alanine carboxypeptidase
MGWGRFAPSYRRALVSLVVAVIGLGLASEAQGRAQRVKSAGVAAQSGAADVSKPAERRAGKRSAKRGGARSAKRRNNSQVFGEKYAAIVIDDNSGTVLYEVKPDELRHPASLAKVMTLYLLFEQIEAGKLRLDTPLPVSRHAATQRPVRLGLKADQTITVENAIKALVTKSANDAAAVVAEAIGGTEEEFAKLMTLKARSLGMERTIYINASGLPADEQITTAREQATLGRAIQHRFPQYFHYFATPTFTYRGRDIRNHNNLLGKVEGVDGIKTGYTDASGYNLLSSVHRGKKNIIGVVLGGPSNSARDTRMRKLIEEAIPDAALERTAPRIVERPIESVSSIEKAAPPAAAAAHASNATAEPNLTQP